MVKVDNRLIEVKDAITAWVRQPRQGDKYKVIICNRMFKATQGVLHNLTREYFHVYPYKKKYKLTS